MNSPSSSPLLSKMATVLISSYWTLCRCHHLTYYLILSCYPLRHEQDDSISRCGSQVQAGTAAVRRCCLRPFPHPCDGSILLGSLLLPASKTIPLLMSADSQPHIKEPQHKHSQIKIPFCHSKFIYSPLTNERYLNFPGLPSPDLSLTNTLSFLTPISPQAS